MFKDGTEHGDENDLLDRHVLFQEGHDFNLMPLIVKNDPKVSDQATRERTGDNGRQVDPI
jgi:hypothetical protein